MPSEDEKFIDEVRLAQVSDDESKYAAEVVRQSLEADAERAREAAREIYPDPPSATWPKAVVITREQAEALMRVFDIDRTAKFSHGGLQDLLRVSEADVRALAEVVALLK